jgi:hypothetical protein
MNKRAIRRLIIKPLTILFLSFFVCYLHADVKELRKVLYYPKETQDYYFRPLISLMSLGNLIFAIENLRNKAIALNLVYPRLTYAFDLGRPGQGPGDLMHPMSLSIWNEEIAIKDSGFFSFFDKNGRFLSKFRVFENEKAFIYQDNKIYWLNPTLDENHLIEVYLKEGKRISTIGKKFIEADVRAFRNPSLIESLLYEGNLFSDGKSLFYFNSRFGRFIIFSFEGKVLSEGDISKIFGERGEKIKEFNNDVYIKRTKKENQASGYPRPVIFEDGYLHKDKLYFINSIIKKNGEKTIFELKILKAKTMNLLDEYVITKEGVCRLDSLAVIEIDNEAFVLLSITVLNEGYYLELYAK